MSTHSRLAASAADRWIRCPGSIAYVEFLLKEGKIKPRPSGSAAELGTACHEVLEYCVKKDIAPTDLKPSVIKKLTKIPLKYDDLKGVEYYWTRVQEDKEKFDVTYTERKYDLSNRYGTDLGGTADVTQAKMKDLLQIGDYKNGRTVVETSSYQIRIYGLGAFYEFNEKYNFSHIQFTIGQPNAYHTDGSVRSETITVKELMKWEKQYLIPAVQKIKNGTTELIPGKKQCLWCDARNHCEANAKQAIQIAQLDFAGCAEPRQDLPVAQDLTKEQIVFILDNKDRLVKFLKGIEEYAFELLDSNERLGNYRLSEKKGNRKLLPEAELKSVLKEYKLTIKSVKPTPEPKYFGITDMERFLDKDKGWKADRIAEFMKKATTRASGKRQLSKTTGHTAEKDFGHLIEAEPEAITPKRKPSALRKKKKLRRK